MSFKLNFTLIFTTFLGINENTQSSQKTSKLRIDTYITYKRRIYRNYKRISFFPLIYTSWVNDPPPVYLC